MYAFLKSIVPPPVAYALIVAWYVLLIVLIVALSALPPGEFRYGHI